jgi:pimeloyl-ACP methyl ester carboxylesterase
MEKLAASRRKFLSAGLPLGLAAVAGAEAAYASLAGAAPMAAATTAAGRAPEGEIWSQEYWAQRGDIKLNLFRKRASAPKPGDTNPILFLAHGSSISSRPSYDLHVPGHGEYSFMDVLARDGFDVWTMDFAGYGRSSKPDTNCNVAEGVEDLKAAVPVIARETGQERFHFYGESSGALRVGVYAMAQPERVNRLVLASFTYTGKDSPTLMERAKQLDFYRTHNRRPRDLAMIQSIFTRDKAGTTDPAVAEALAKAELPLGDSVPTGTYFDMVANLPLVDPAEIQSPVLIARGEFDGIATLADLSNFFLQLPVADRQFAILPGLAHSLGTGYNRQCLWYTVREFLGVPPRQDKQSGV